MVVSAFGSPVDVAAWDQFSTQTRIPVLIDGAASFDSVASSAINRPGRTPIMVSLHATKVFGVGEGGFVICSDRDFITRFTRICNFGVLMTPEGQILGYNGKESEYHAAVGLSNLDGWPERRARMADLTERYRIRLGNRADISLVPGYGEGWISCYCNIRVKQEAAGVIEHLRLRGVETRRWWQLGVHHQRAYRDFTRDPLPHTEELAPAVFGLPFFHDITDSQIDLVVDALFEALDTIPVTSK